MSQSRIIVGIDESAGARAAFEWALEQARLRGATLVLVRAYEATGGAFPYPPLEGGIQPDLLESMEREERQAAETFLEELAAAAPDDVAVETHAVRGRPAQELLGMAEDAAMIVVGSRGRGGFAGLLLGSVSQQIVHHAPCPVVVIPAPALDETS